MQIFLVALFQIPVKIERKTGFITKERGYLMYHVIINPRLPFRTQAGKYGKK